MIAYDTTALDNQHILEQSGRALKKKLITKDEFDQVSAAHAVKLYSPNMFIRTGLFLATVLIVSMSLGLFTLILGAMMNSTLGAAVMIAVFGMVIYAALEFMVREKNHCRSGVDDGLMWMSMALLAGDLLLYFDMPALTGSMTILIFALFAAGRFGNTIMSALAYLSFLSVLFHAITPIGNVAKIILPFFLFAVSMCIYFLAHSKRNNPTWRHYRNCILMIEFLSLISTYAAVNYFIVRELSFAMFSLPTGTEITGSWFFWLATAVIPVIYIWLGLKSKDKWLLRTGLLLSAAAVSTFRAYIWMAPVEAIMTVSGAILILLAYFIIRYFRKPRNGITDKQPGDDIAADHLHLEGLVVSETFQPPTAAEQGFNFGGGSSGGGGATGQY